MMANPPPFFKARHPDLARDLMGIRSYEHRGFYFTLLLAYWANCEPFADELAAKLALQIHGKKWNSFLPIFHRLFSKKDDEKWHHDGLDAQLYRIEITSEARREAGRKGNEIKAQLRTHLRPQLRTHLRPKPDAIAVANGPPNPVNSYLPLTTEHTKPRPRARPASAEGKKIKKPVFGADPKAGNGHAQPSRSSTPGFKQVRPSHVTPATANLMSQCARFLGEDKATQFWSDMMSPEAATVLSNTAKAMRDSGWKDPG